MVFLDISSIQGTGQDEINAWSDYQDYCAATFSGGECDTPWGLCTLEELCPFAPLYPSPSTLPGSSDNLSTYSVFPGKNVWLPYADTDNECDPVKNLNSDPYPNGGTWVQIADSSYDVCQTVGQLDIGGWGVCMKWGDDIAKANNEKYTTKIACCGCGDVVPKSTRVESCMM
jgi:hypothetical protein